jgi:Mitochondrial carrier protein
MSEAIKHILEEGGFWSLWAGTPSRTVEGALLGAFFMLGSTITKRKVLAMGGSPFVAALAGGTVGGVAQALVMTPAGMIFTSLNVNRGKKGHENDNAITVARRIMKEKGPLGLYYGMGPMCMRQASNWASRSGFTEIARTNFKMSKYGVWGEIGSGIIGGVGSTWNTPIETIRVLMQKDVSQGKSTKPFMQYWHDIVDDQGNVGLFRGWTPRTIQAVWQTVFMVVVPNMLGI